jgi:hypothetical protein
MLMVMLNGSLQGMRLGVSFKKFKVLNMKCVMGLCQFHF